MYMNFTFNGSDVTTTPHHMNKLVHKLSKPRQGSKLLVIFDSWNSTTLCATNYWNPSEFQSVVEDCKV